MLQFVLTKQSITSGGGIQRRTPAENFSDEDWDEVIQVNLQAVWVISRDAGRHMLESRGGVSGGDPVAEGAADSNPRGRGKIINIASLISYQGTSCASGDVLSPTNQVFASQVV